MPTRAIFTGPPRRGPRVIAPPPRATRAGAPATALRKFLRPIVFCSSVEIHDVYPNLRMNPILVYCDITVSGAETPRFPIAASEVQLPPPQKRSNPAIRAGVEDKQDTDSDGFDQCFFTIR